jgi:hypothetical protein
MAAQLADTYIINHLLTGLLAARSLARIPSGESIAPIRLPFLREDTFSTTRFRTCCGLARIIHEGSLRKRADATRDRHSEA